MIPKEAIERAIEGGWDKNRALVNDGIHANAIFVNQVVALDPAFWQCLGKALGWKMTSCDEDAGAVQGRDVLHDPKLFCSSCHFGPGESCRAWLYHASSFYDLILTGGDTKAFWTGLLNTNDQSKTEEEKR